MINRYRAPVKLSQEAVRKLSRWQFLTLLVIALCTAFCVSDLWTLREITASALASSMSSHGLTGWLMPSLVGTPFVTLGPSVHWVSSILVGLLGENGLVPVLSDVTILRITADLFLIGTLGFLWFAARIFAKQNAVQPLTFAFGGEAQPRSYARAVADITCLLFIATFGILTRRHEVISDTGLLFVASFNLWTLAYSLINPKKGARYAGLATALTLFTTNVYFFIVSLLINAWCYARIPTFGDERQLRLKNLALVAFGAVALWPALSFLVNADYAQGWWSSWIGQQLESISWAGFSPLIWFLRNGLWYTLPLWPLVIVALVRWHKQRKEAELRIPALTILFTILLSVFSGHEHNELVFLWFIPGMSLLSAFGLVTLRGRHRSILDWFSITTGSLVLIIAWSYWLAWKFGLPPKMSQSLTLLAPGSHPAFDAGFVLAIIASLLWIGLTGWRFTHRPPFVWSGAWLCAWGMTAGLAVWVGLFHLAVDTNRSYMPIAHSVRTLFMAVGGEKNNCLNTVGVPQGLAQYLSQQTGIRFAPHSTVCHFTLIRTSKHFNGMNIPAHAVGPIARPHTNEFFYLISDK